MEKVIEIVSAVTKQNISFLKENMDADNLWNSLTRVEIFLTIEEEFDIFFEEEEIKNIRTLKQLINAVEGKI